MEISALVIFALALLVTAGSPGPSIAALVARVLARGWQDVAPFLAAMWLGELLWLSLAVAGLSAIAERFHWAFLIAKYVGVVYLLYLAWRMWTKPVVLDTEDTAPDVNGRLDMFFAGLTVTLGNPKIMVFYLALLPTIIDLERVALGEWATLATTMLLVIATVDLAYVGLASRVRRIIGSPPALRIANRVSATVMGGAAAAIATR